MIAKFTNEAKEQLELENNLTKIVAFELEEGLLSFRISCQQDRISVDWLKNRTDVLKEFFKQCSNINLELKTYE